jgi:hypothetical protein
MRNSLILVTSFIMLSSVPCMARSNNNYRVEGLPTKYLKRINEREQKLQDAAKKDGIRVYGFFVKKVKWNPGQTVKVAFRKPDESICKRIADTATEWTKADSANVKFDFGYNATTKKYRSWSPSDTAYAAEIRIDFASDDDYGGFWSQLGTDSIRVVSSGEASMNLEGFDKNSTLPADWAETVRHEFGHALGFDHEHQHPTEGCENEFQWDPQPGYVDTTTSKGEFIRDSKKRSPGVYKAMGGPLNNWKKDRIDANMRQAKPSANYALEPFDKASIMLYALPDFYFKTGTASKCFVVGNTAISVGDKKLAKKYYPSSPTSIKTVVQEKNNSINQLKSLNL